jgi:hypothetical protein
MIQLENRWTDFDDIWCGRYAIGDCPTLVLLYFLQSITLNMSDERTCEVGVTLAPLTIG